MKMFDFHFFYTRFCLQSNGDCRDASPGDYSLAMSLLLELVFQLRSPFFLLDFAKLVLLFPPLVKNGFVYPEFSRGSLIAMFIRVTDHLKFELCSVSVSLHKCHFQGAKFVLSNPRTGIQLLASSFMPPPPFNVSMPSSVTSAFPLYKQRVCITSDSQAERSLKSYSNINRFWNSVNRLGAPRY